MELNDKLQVLRAVMLDVITQQKPFNMCEWVAIKGREADCRTSSCAYGWLARDPRGQALGLGIRYHESDAGEIYEAVITYNDVKDQYGDEFIGHSNMSDFLFMPGSYYGEGDDDGYIPPEAVIKHIDHLLAGHSPRAYKG